MGGSPRSAPQILSAEDEVAGCHIATFNGGAQVLQSTRDDKGGIVSTPKMDEVVCAHNFFLSERGEADFASDYIPSVHHRHMLINFTLPLYQRHFIRLCFLCLKSPGQGWILSPLKVRRNRVKAREPLECC